MREMGTTLFQFTRLLVLLIPFHPTAGRPAAYSPVITPATAGYSKTSRWGWGWGSGPGWGWGWGTGPGYGWGWGGGGGRLAPGGRKSGSGLNAGTEERG